MLFRVRGWLGFSDEQACRDSRTEEHPGFEGVPSYLGRWFERKWPFGGWHLLVFTHGLSPALPRTLMLALGNCSYWWIWQHSLGGPLDFIFFQPCKSPSPTVRMSRTGEREAYPELPGGARILFLLSSSSLFFLLPLSLPSSSSWKPLEAPPLSAAASLGFLCTAEVSD